MEKNKEEIVVLDNNNFRIQIFDTNWRHIKSQKIAKTYTSFALLEKESFVGSPIVNRTQEHLFEALDLQGELLNSGVPIIIPEPVIQYRLVKRRKPGKGFMPM